MPPPESAAPAPPDGQPAPTVEVTSAVLRGWPLPDVRGGKEERGRVLVVGGSDRTPGAVLLAGEAALRSGAGKLQIATTSGVAPALAVAVPEAMVRPLPTAPSGDIDPAAADVLLELADGCSAVLLGPGALDVDTFAELLAGVVPHLQGTVVLDAGALAYVGAHRDALHHLEGDAVLTPNLTELALMLGRDAGDVEDDPLGAARGLAAEARAVVSVGGGVSRIVDPAGRAWTDHSGGAGLGVSGSGDVLAGVVVGLAARGAEAAQAAVWAAHLHGRAGDRLAGAVGPVGYLARELPAQLPRVLAEIEV